MKSFEPQPRGGLTEFELARAALAVAEPGV